MLYHSDSIQDCQKFLAISDEVGGAWKTGGGGAPVTTDEEEEKGEKAPVQTVTTEQDTLLQQFRTLGSQLDEILSFMVDRLQGQQYFNRLLDETVENAQKLIDEKVAEKMKEREAAERALMEAEEAAMKEYLVKQEEERKRLEEEEKKKKEEEEKKEEAKPAKPAPKVVVSKSVGRAPRASVRRLAPAKPAPKAQGKKGASAAKRGQGQTGDDSSEAGG